MGYSCVACATQFKGVAEHRAHYKSVWHRYNLKRKVAGLVPMPEHIFVAKRDAALRNARANEKQEFHAKCTACSKSFASVNAYRQHLESKKHKKAAQKAAGRRDRTSSRTSAAGSVASGVDETKADTKAESKTAPAAVVDAADAPEDVGATGAVEETPSAAAAASAQTSGVSCPFCNQHFRTSTTAVNHMRREHSFIVPDTEYLRDLDGLLAYVNAKIHEGHLCTYCMKHFGSGQATQKHMVDKGHCRILYQEGQDMDEYEEFYDFTRSYPAELQGKLPRTTRHSRVRAAAAAAAGVDGDGAGTGAGAGDGDAAMDASDSEEEGDISLEELRRGVEVLPSGELRMRDGRVIGHRQYRRYYRQNIMTGVDSEHVAVQRAAIVDALHGPGASAAVVAGRAQGRTGSRSMVVAQRAYRGPMSRDESARQRKHFEARRRKKDIEVGVRANKLQKFFRAQVMF